MRWSAVLLSDPLDPAQEYACFLASLCGEGATASFLGAARPRDRDGAAVHKLFLDHHPRLSAKSLDDIARAACERFDVRVRVVHRCGDVAAGEPIVFVAAASPHRRAAFDAVDYLMDRLKTEAVLWKREDGPAGSRWIEPTAADHDARARWSD